MTRVASSGKAPDQLGVSESFPAAWCAVARIEFGCSRPVGQRCLKGGGDREGGGDSGDDLEGKRVFAEEGDLLGGASEDKRVSGFESDNRVSGGGVLEHQVVDPRLGDARLSAAFSYRDDDRGWTCDAEDFVGDEVIGQDDVGGFDEVGRAQGEKRGIAWTSTYQIDITRFGVGD